MTHSVSDRLLSRLSEFVADRMGLHFPKERWRDLERGLDSAAQKFNFGDAESCTRWLLSSPLTKGQIETLASYLTIGETYFLREKKALEALKEHILPHFIRNRRGAEQRLRIWSAGCSTGEEAYTVAMLLDQLIPDIENWRINITATDINPLALQKASEGVYSEWSFRDTPQWIKEKYFKRKNESRYEILPRIRKMVNFSDLNLAEDAYPSCLNDTDRMDVVLCRNVLIYFTPEQAKKVIKNFHLSLVAGGWLVVGQSELSNVFFSEFATVHFPGAVIYQKESAKPQAVAGFKHKSDDELAYAAHQLFDLLAEHELESAPSHESRETIRLEDNERKTEGSPQTRYAEALALYEQGRYGEAADAVLKLVPHKQGDPKAVALLARAYANQGKLTEALEWCEEAISIDKSNPGCHYLLATIRQEQNQAEEAMKALKRALYLDQNFVLAHFALGNLTHRQGKFKESEKHFENALALLSAYGQEDILSESEGMTAGRLIDIIRQVATRRAFA